MVFLEWLLSSGVFFSGFSGHVCAEVKVALLLVALQVQVV